MNDDNKQFVGFTVALGSARRLLAMPQLDIGQSGGGRSESRSGRLRCSAVEPDAALVELGVGETKRIGGVELGGML